MKIMCETNSTTNNSASGNNVSVTGSIYVPTPPACYEPKDPCENCALKDSCTKRNKPQPTWIPIPYPWYIPYYPIYTVTSSIY